MSEDNLLDDDAILVPQTLPSPHRFSTQLVKRLHVKSFLNRRRDAVNSNTNTTITGEHNNNNGVCGQPIIFHLFTYLFYLL